MPLVLQKTISNYERLMSEEHEISNVVQCSLWKDVILPQFTGKTVLPLNINFDDFEPDNLAGSHQGDHKIGGTYYNCPVVPQKYLGTLKNIFVAQLFLSDDRNVIDGNEKAFHMLLEELNFLEEEGILIFGQRVYFALTLMLGDNLGIHSILGFTEGFTANYPCRLCRMHKRLVQRMVSVPQHFLRTPDNYAADVETNDQSLTGVYENCVFNQVNTYHVTVNQSVDIMHDILEGVAKYDMSRILDYFIYQRAYFSLETLILRVNDFDYGPTESGNKPPAHKLTRDRIVNDTLNFSSAEMLCFVRYFGLMVGDLVPEDDPVWDFYLSLRDIVDILFAPSFSRGTEELLKHYVEFHHRMYMELFLTNLKPKYHHMIHYWALLLLIGPLIHFSGMRWESKHRELKQIAKATCSRMNLPLTLITKYCLKLGFRFFSKIGFQMEYDIGICESIPRNIVDPENVIDQFLIVDAAARHFECVAWARLNGVYFRVGLVVHVGFSADYPNFAVIDRIIYQGLSGDGEPQIVFVCHMLITRLFNRHYHAYEVEESNEWLVVSYEHILSSHPLAMRVLPVGGAFVSTRYML